MTSSYFNERLRRLDDVWGRFEEVDVKIRTLENRPVSHDYFTSDYYTQIAEVVEKYKNVFRRAASEIDTATAASKNPGGTGAVGITLTPDDQPVSINKGQGQSGGVRGLPTPPQRKKNTVESVFGSSGDSNRASAMIRRQSAVMT